MTREWCVGAWEMAPTQYVVYRTNILNSSKKKKINIKKPGDMINLESLGGTEREKIRRDFNHLAYNKIFYSTTKLFKQTVVMVHGNYKVNYSGYAFYNTIIVSKYYHQLADKNFLRYFNFKQTILVVEGTHYQKLGMFIEKRIVHTHPTPSSKKRTFLSQKFFCMI